MTSEPQEVYQHCFFFPNMSPPYPHRLLALFRDSTICDFFFSATFLYGIKAAAKNNDAGALLISNVC